MSLLENIAYPNHAKWLGRSSCKTTTLTREQQYLVFLDIYHQHALRTSVCLELLDRRKVIFR